MSIYTSRYIAKGLREDLPLVWLAWKQRPRFRSIYGLRSKRFNELIDSIFGRTNLVLAKHHYITLDGYCIDGTVNAAHANKHSYVWKKITQRHKARTLDQVH